LLQLPFFREEKTVENESFSRGVIRKGKGPETFVVSYKAVVLAASESFRLNKL
jgi:hypothetical protein